MNWYHYLLIYCVFAWTVGVVQVLRDFHEVVDEVQKRLIFVDPLFLVFVTTAFIIVTSPIYLPIDCWRKLVKIKRLLLIWYFLKRGGLMDENSSRLMKDLWKKL